MPDRLKMSVIDSEKRVSTMHSDMNKIVRDTKLATRTFYVLILLVTMLLVYWTFEPDPLVVERVDGDSMWSTCSERQYTFRRIVKSTKELDVYVQERWHDLDGFMDEGNIKGELIIPNTIHYPMGKDFEKVMEFKKKVPDSIGVGRYTYSPWATYQVNPLKTITKELPYQKVQVVCNREDLEERRRVKESQIK